MSPVKQNRILTKDHDNHARTPKEMEKGRNPKSESAILESRFRKLALRKPINDRPLPTIHVICFKAKENEHYALSIDRIEKIIPLNTITKVPKSNELIRGVLFYNGLIHALIDLKMLLELPGEKENQNGYGLVLKNRRSILFIDEITGLEPLNPSELKIPSENQFGTMARFTKAIAPEKRILLDMDKIVEHPVIKE